MCCANNLRLLGLAVTVATVTATTTTAIAAAPAPPSAAASAAANTIAYGRFGDISIYQAGEPREMILFLSGDGGWNLGVISMARLLQDKGAVVAGINVRHYLEELEKSSEKCVSPAVDFENLSHYLQSKLGV